MRKLQNPPTQVALSTANSASARKAELCAQILAEARRLVRIGQFGSPLNQLVLRACELLDDMDEVLVALHPVQSGGDFTTAAALHRELEQIQAAISSKVAPPHPRRKRGAHHN
jgi:hypothetical protein